ncbi:hypothetical protein F7725_010853, partial [Dissostichus mawsoni]
MFSLKVTTGRSPPSGHELCVFPAESTDFKPEFPNPSLGCCSATGASFSFSSGSSMACSGISADEPLVAGLQRQPVPVHQDSLMSFSEVQGPEAAAHINTQSEPIKRHLMAGRGHSPIISSPTTLVEQSSAAHDAQEGHEEDRKTDR